MHPFIIYVTNSNLYNEWSTRPDTPYPTYPTYPYATGIPAPNPGTEQHNQLYLSPPADSQGFGAIYKRRGGSSIIVPG